MKPDTSFYSGPLSRVAWPRSDELGPFGKETVGVNRKCHR